MTTLLCMGVIALSGIVEAIISYKKKRHKLWTITHATMAIAAIGVGILQVLDMLKAAA